MKDARTDPFIQTDLSVHHEIAVHEGQRLEFEANVINLFNQRASQGVSEFAIPTGLIISDAGSPLRRRSASGLGQGDERLSTTWMH